MNDPSQVKNLERIQESEGHPAVSRFGSLVLASLGGACLVFAAVALGRRPGASAPPPVDPLADLVEKSRLSAPAATVDTRLHDVSFPGLLSDSARPTTALAAVREEPKPSSSAAAAAASAAPLAREAPAVPPPATDRLPVVPLPAQSVISASPVVTNPRDSLTVMAAELSTPTAPPIGEGRAGGWQLQASSFRTEPEAEAFAQALRRRGHHGYVEMAEIPGRGVWYRVRIGPFKSQHDALAYRSDFEQKEHLAPFVVEPARDKVVATKRSDDAAPRTVVRESRGQHP